MSGDYPRFLDSGESALVVEFGAGVDAAINDRVPTGWWLIGRTPERMFAPVRDPAFLVEVGDTLVFDPISIECFAALEARVASGEIVAQRARLR